MARVPEEEIERLKREISLERLVEARGIKLTRTGANLVGLCPFHDDRKTPNLVVTPEKNVFHCFACEASGSVIDWVMQTEGVSFRHAVEVLRGGGNFEASSGAPSKKGSVKKLAPLAERGAGGTELLERVVGVYHATLKESPDALAYLKSRGLEHPEVIDRFKLGYANRTLGYRLPESNRKAGAELRGELEAIGVYRASGHEHLAGSLVIPLFDAGGRVVQLYGRKVGDHLRAGTPLHLYLPGPHRGVFNRDALSASDEVILCESVIDALTFWCAGFRNVTTAYGVEGFTEELAQALVSARVRVVKIAFDRDEAGERGAEKVGAKLNALGVETYRMVFPRGMDANEYAQKVGPAAKSLELTIRQATWMGADAGAASPAPSETLEEAAEIESSVAPDEPPFLAASSAAAPSAAPPSLAPPPTTTTTTKRGEKKGEDWHYRFGDRTWRVKPVDKKHTANALKVQLRVMREGKASSTASAEPRSFFLDTVELYSAKQREIFVKQAAAELDVEESVVRRELGAILMELEAEREAEAEAALLPAAPIAMSEVEREEAMELLRDPKLLDRIVEDLGRTGIVGEETNKLLGYLAATSRKLEEPLAIVIQSSSAAGKSSLMDAVLSLMPEEDRVQYSAMTGQSLFYMSGQDLKHKILAIVEEEGAERASYALKLLQSEGELTIASTGKDPATGRLVTETYRVEGPVMIFLTTTAIEVDEELLNRCLVLAVDEGREQTLAIHVRQRQSQTIEGRMEREARQRIRRTHRNAQKLLKPVVVVNPYAPELSFASHVTRTRRDHMKYLTLIRAVALLHQMQRPVKTAVHREQRLEYIEVTREDIEVANRLASTVLGQCLDELPPQTRRLLELVHAMVLAWMEREGLAQHEVRFTRRDVREWTQWGNTQLKVHLGRLEELEYVLVHRAGRGAGRGVLMQYEFAYDLNWSGSGPNLSGANEEKSGPSRGVGGPKSGGWRGALIAQESSKQAANGIATANGAAHARHGSATKTASYA